MRQFLLFLMILVFSLGLEAYSQQGADTHGIRLQSGAQNIDVAVPIESFSELTLLVNLKLNKNCKFDSEEFISLNLTNNDASSDIKDIEFARIYLPSYNENRNDDNSITYSFDLTLWQMLLQNTPSINVFYQGKSTDLELACSFEYEKGTPSVGIIGILPLWQSGPAGFSYGKKGVEKKYLPIRHINLPENTHSAFVSVLVSGLKKEHSNKASSRFYFLEVNNTEIAKRSIWRADCGLNPIYPQHKEWYKNNHNWCPGLRVNALTHRIDNSFLQEDSLAFSLRFQNDINETSGVEAYITSAVLFVLAEATELVDVSITEIMAPNAEIWHHRYNPICGNPIILIQNNGSQNAESIIFNYGYNFQTDNKYRWNGSLAYMEQEIVYLPAPNWYFYGQDDEPQTFTVHVSRVNGDENHFKGKSKTSPMELAQVFPNKISVEIQTDGNAFQNGIEIYNEDDEVVFRQGGFDNYSKYQFDVELDPGCYEMIFYDMNGDGLNLKDAKPCLLIRNQATETILNEFQGDFGMEIREQFMILK